MNIYILTAATTHKFICHYLHERKTNIAHQYSEHNQVAFNRPLPVKCHCLQEMLC